MTKSIFHKQLQLSYDGSDFLLDVAEGNIVNLNSLHQIVGSPNNKDPRTWRRSTSAKSLAETFAYKLNVRKSHIKAVYSTIPPDPSEIEQVNIEGTEN